MKKMFYEIDLIIIWENIYFVKWYNYRQNCVPKFKYFGKYNFFASLY